MNTICLVGLCAALSLPCLATTQQIAIEIKQIERPELKGRVLSYNHRLVDVDSLAKGIDLGYQYETLSGGIITYPHREARPLSYYILDDGRPKTLQASQGWHTFRYPNANNKHVSEANLNIQRSPQGDPIYVDGAMRAQVSVGIASSELFSLAEEEGTFPIGDQVARYKRFIYRGDLAVEIIMNQSDILDEFYFHDAEGKKVEPRMRSMTGMSKYTYTYTFSKAYPAALSYSYKQAPYDVDCPLRLCLLGKCVLLSGNATGDIHAQVAEFQLKIDSDTLDIAEGKLRLLVSAPVGVKLCLDGPQELSLSTKDGEALPPLKLMPKNVCYDRNSKQMYILTDLPNIKGSREIIIKGELKLKVDGLIRANANLPLDTNIGGSVIINNTSFNYKAIPVMAKSPWCYLAFTCPEDPSAILDSGFAPVFLDAHAQQLASSPQLIKAIQREQLGLPADMPAKLYRFRKCLPSAIQSNSTQAGATSIPICLELQLGVSRELPELPPNAFRRKH
ncbi:MAG: hypothetical protein R3Y56_00630 [Akkermansia sp.]